MKLYAQVAALAAIGMTLPLLAMAQDTQAAQSQDANAGQYQTAQMVPAYAVLTRHLDAKAVHDGQVVHAKLNRTVDLKNGVKLPSGTVLIGHVVQDDMNHQGVSKLALRFDQAQTKDGKIVPVKATLVAISGSVYSDGRLHNTWSSGTQQIDQIGALPGVDLHSNITSNNSGVLVSKKSDVKLGIGSQFEFVLAPVSGA